jgi:methionyl-tRNA formyltransferase
LIKPPTDVKRVVYLGTPELAVRPLLALHEAGYDIPLGVSRPDKRRGRGSELSPSPVKAAAEALGIPVTTNVDDVLDVDADLGVVVAFGRLIKPHVLDRLAMVNLHFSLLPRWRGAAPVERAILAGDETTGVCLMELAEGLDTGDVYRVQTVPIGADQSLDDLRASLVEIGTELLVAALGEGLGTPQPQVGDAVHAAKIDRAELQIDWTSSAAAIHRLIRVGDAWTTEEGNRLKIWRATVTDRDDLAPAQVDGVTVGTGDGAIELIELQPAGKPRRSAQDWANGARLSSDDRLGD